MDTGSEDKLGRKARILDGRAATVVDHYTGTFLGDSVEMLTLRLDMAEDVATYGRADFEMLASDVDFSDGPVLIRSERIRVILSLSDWVAAVTSARRGKDERSAEVAARGTVLRGMGDEAWMESCAGRCNYRLRACIGWPGC